MIIPQSVQDWLAAQHYGHTLELLPVSGGSICNSFKLITQKGPPLFLKTLDQPPSRLFEAEAFGLRSLAATQTIRIPKTAHCGDDFILLEYIAPGAKDRNYWERFGTQLAELHNHYGPCFGFAADNYCGSTPQPNARNPNGYHFFAEQRLIYLARLALERSLLTTREVSQLEELSARLPMLIPEQPPSLIHGDLWSGNAHNDEAGEPVLIDPACYWGWAEAEIAMTTLFGGFPPLFYEAYQTARPMEPGWEQRLGLYNLYHLLNHLNLFGMGYHTELMETLRRYH